MGSDFLDLLRRKTPPNGPVNTPIESWTILAPGTGGMGAPTCDMCFDQMLLYDDIVGAAEPYTDRTVNRYYKNGQPGLFSASTYLEKPKAIYPRDALDDLIVEFQARGYDKPITYVPPNTLCARIDWDAFHVPHVVGDTVEDVTFGLGYATVYTNMIEMLFFRYAGLSGLLQTGLHISPDEPLDIASLVKQLMDFKPLNYSRDELMDTFDPRVCDALLGPDCQEMASAMVAYREGINKALMERYPAFKVFDTLGIPWPKWEVIDTAAPGLAITGVFGDPGADQLANLATWRKIQAVFGEDKAKALFADYKLRNAPLDPTTVTAKDPFPNPVYADGSDDTDAQRPVDDDSIAWVDLKAIESNPATRALLNVDKPHNSNWMLITKDKSATGHPLLVGGPQMSYFRPDIFMEFDARTVDNRFQITGVSLPGLFIAAFAGSGHDGVWSPTSAIGKTSDIFVEKLCSPDGQYPIDLQAKYYWYQGQCKPMRLRPDNGTPFTVHGPVIAWDTVAGEPVAIARKSYNAERIGQGAIPYYALAKGKVKTAAQFVDLMQYHVLALNYAYINATEVAYVNTGLYPVRAAGAQTDLPTWGTGQWDWQGAIPLERRPHAINPPGGYILSWNNQSAPKFYQSDGDFQRVQMLQRLVNTKSTIDLPALVQIAETAALQDGYALSMMPLLRDYTQGAILPNGDLSNMLNELAAWIDQKGAKRIDLDRDGRYDDAGPAIMDEIMVCLKNVLEDSLQLDLGSLNLPNSMGSAYQDGTTSIMRMLLNRAKANGNDPANVREDLLQCGDGTFIGCRRLVLKALVQAKADLKKSFGTDTPALWLKTADHIELMPVNTTNNGKPWHWQNRPTFQQAATVQ